MVHPVIFKKVQALALDNSTAILSSVGVVGTVTTAVLTGRASYKAAHVARDLAEQDISAGPITKQEIAKEVWPLFIPAVGVGGVTIASIIFAHRVSAKEAAAMAAAYGLSEKALEEYKEKVVEKLGQNKETDIRDSIAQDRVNANPPTTSQLILAGSGKVLCHDVLTGRYFESSVEEIKRAENAVNADIVNCSYASLSQFYDEVGLPPTPYSDQVGWNLDNKCEVQFSTVMAPDDRPCISVDFAGWPKPDYTKTWG